MYALLTRSSAYMRTIHHLNVASPRVVLLGYLQTGRAPHLDLPESSVIGERIEDQFDLIPQWMILIPSDRETGGCSMLVPPES